MKTRWPVLAAFVLSSAASLTVRAEPQKPAPRARTLAPAASVATLEGKTLELSELVAGKPTLLIFWATWCPNCREQTPRFKAAFERYAPKPKGLNVIAVDTGRLPQRPRHDSSASASATQPPERLQAPAPHGHLSTFPHEFTKRKKKQKRERAAAATNPSPPETRPRKRPQSHGEV